jgi:membrane protein DedA with SNARE-associated domain
MDTLNALYGSASLWLLSGVTLAHEIGLPIPAMPVALYIGARHVGHARDLPVFTLGMVLATLMGNLFWYGAGRNHGPDVRELMIRWSIISEAKLQRAERAFKQWGSLLLLLGHFLPGVTVVAPPLAGALGMRADRFCALTTAGAVIYGVTLLGTGMLLRDQFGAALALLDNLQAHAWIPIAALAGAWAWWSWRRNRVGTRANA